METAYHVHSGGAQQAQAASSMDNMLYMVAGGILLIVLATRVITGILGASKRTPRGDTIPVAPYWIPVVGHIPQFFLFRESFFAWARRNYGNGAFALNMFGTTHNVIFKPSLGKTLLDQKNEIVDAGATAKHMMQSIFGWPTTEMAEYDSALGDIIDAYRHLTTNPGLSKIIDVTVAQLKTNINNLVTFSPSPVDQTHWERRSSVEPTTSPGGEPAEEVELYTLLRDFVAHTVNSALYGTDLVNNNPNMWQDFWQMDSGFMYLATGLPRWVPIPTVTRSVLARRRLLGIIRPFEVAMDKWSKGEDPGSDWGNLDDVSDLIKRRIQIYQKHNVSFEARAACELALVWATNANSNPLIFWIICRVYSDPDLLEQIRNEVRPFVKVRVPKQEFAFEEPPILEDVDHEGLGERCPLLKAAYIESMRLDTSIMNFRIMRQDYTVAGKAKDGDSDRFLVEKGTFCHVMPELHHLDPAAYENPHVWRAERHIKYEPSKDAEKGTSKADMGNVRPYGGGPSMCKGRHFASKEIMILTATIFTFWDMEPAKGGMWKMPTPLRLTGTNGIKGEMRVKIKRRKLQN